MMEKLADYGAAISVGGTSWAWLSHANDIATFVATLVAIAAGLFTLYWHYRKWKGDNESSTND